MSFADDLLIFTCGDTKSVELVMDKIHNFPRSTGLHVNPSKCKIFYGGVEERIKDSILKVTSFAEGSFLSGILGCHSLARSFLSITTCPWWIVLWSVFVLWSVCILLVDFN
jgi:hypothetical protein